MVDQARRLTEETQVENAGLWERSLLEIKVCTVGILCSRASAFLVLLDKLDMP